MERPERIAFSGGRQADVVHIGADVRPRPPAAKSAKGEAATKPPAREKRDLAYWGLVGFTAMVFLRPQDLFPPLEVLHLAEVFAIVGLVAMANGRLSRQERVLPLSREVIALLIFTGILLALVPFSIWPGGSLNMLTSLYLKVVLIFILMAGTLTTPARLKTFVWVIVLTSGYLAFRGVFDYVRGINLIENGRIVGAVGGVFNNPNDLAMNMVAILPLALLIMASDKRPSRRIVAGIVSALMLGTIVFTKSRGGFLGLLAMFLVMLFQGNKIKRGFGAVLLVMLVAALPLAPASFWARMASITDPSLDQTGSRESRQTDMREALSVFLERPLTGVGAGELPDYNPTWRVERWREAHNVLLQVAADDGIFGLLVFSYLVARALSMAWGTSRLTSKWRRRGSPALTEGQRVAFLYGTSMTASLTGWFVCAMFASVAYTWTFYYVFGIVVAARHIAVTYAPSVTAGARTSIAAA